MATITITKGFSVLIGTFYELLSIHVPTTTTFDFDRGAISGSYTEVVINGYPFRATKTNTVGNIDTYQLNGEMLKYVLGIPTFDILALNSLSKDCTVVYNGYDSTGTLIATATDTTFKLCNALPTTSLYNLINYGRSEQTVYYFGLLTYYNVSTKSYDNYSGNFTGLFTSGGCSFNVVRVPLLGKVLYWLNIDGCWDSGSFTEITKETKAKQSNPIALYTDNLENWKGYEFNTQNEVEEETQYRTIAKNEEHYRQLYFLTKTPIILNEFGEIYELASQPAPIANCKQNLNFTFSLKRAVHAQSY